VPFYEYKCPEGHVFEEFHGMNDPSPEVCPTCGKGPLERVLYPIAVHFKGSGFYTTDYGRGSKRRDGDSKDREGGGGESKPKEEKKEKAAET
jgi:putative FmdB family regulatory protein